MLRVEAVVSRREVGVARGRIDDLVEDGAVTGGPVEDETEVDREDRGRGRPNGPRPGQDPSSSAGSGVGGPSRKTSPEDSILTSGREA